MRCPFPESTRQGPHYPKGLAREAIPHSARIAHLADDCDALTTDRVHKRAITCEEAERMVVGLSGTHFDPAVVAVSMECKGEFRRLAEELADQTPKSDEVHPGNEALRPSLAEA